MKKKLLALVLSNLFSAGAFAQGSNVTVYGTLNADFENVERDGATSPPDAGNSFVPSSAVLGSPITGADLESRNRVSSNSSNIGFRGTEDLGNGLKAIFQLESSINLDAGGGNLGGRNSNVGLTGAWGTVFYGQW
ncbi:MAG: porin, partial [Burkholderiales bacterium]